MNSDFEEVELECEVCHKKVKRVVRKGLKLKKFLCQGCMKKVTETD